MRQGIEAFYNALYPPRCPVCGEILYSKSREKRPDICKECLEKLIYIQQPSCMKCGKQLEEEEQEYCYDCQSHRMEYTRGIACFAYSEAMKQSMYGFKYNNKREYAEFYAKNIVDRYENLILSWKADILIPVPLYKERYRKRGYNQAEVLAKKLSKKLNIPVDCKVLQRSKNTVAQKTLKDKQRVLNIEKAFQTVSNELKYKNIILVDDIYTSGATVNECAKVLKQKGAGCIYYIAVCIGRGF